MGQHELHLASLTAVRAFWHTVLVVVGLDGAGRGGRDPKFLHRFQGLPAAVRSPEYQVAWPTIIERTLRVSTTMGRDSWSVSNEVQHLGDALHVAKLVLCAKEWAEMSDS